MFTKIHNKVSLQLHYCEITFCLLIFIFCRGVVVYQIFDWQVLQQYGTRIGNPQLFPQIFSGDLKPTPPLQSSQPPTALSQELNTDGPRNPNVNAPNMNTQSNSFNNPPNLNGGNNQHVNNNTQYSNQGNNNNFNNNPPNLNCGNANFNRSSFNSGGVPISQNTPMVCITIRRNNVLNFTYSRKMCALLIDYTWTNRNGLLRYFLHFLSSLVANRCY